jgi:hypothetical protein
MEIMFFNELIIWLCLIAGPSIMVHTRMIEFAALAVLGALFVYFNVACGVQLIQARYNIVWRFNL